MQDEQAVEAPAGRVPRFTGFMAVARWVILAIVAAAAVYSVTRYTGISRLLWGKTEEAKTLYHCPMHTNYISDHPGDCPICGMSLVPIPAGSHGSGDGAADQAVGAARESVPTGMASVHLESDKIQLIGVKTVKAGRTSLVPEVESYSVVEVPEEPVSRVHTRTSGWVTGLKVKRTGVKVKKGQVLFRLYSPDAFQAQQEYLLLLAASAQISGGSTSMSIQKDAARTKLEILGVPSGMIASLEKTLKPSKTVPVMAPAGGHVIAKDVYDGMFVSPGSEVLEVADLSTVWVAVKVHQDLSALVKVGDEVRFETDAMPGEEFVGRIDQVMPVLDPALRSREVRIVIPNPDGKLAPGMWGKARIGIEPVEGVALPEGTIVSGGKVNYVFVDNGGGHFEPRIVTVGVSYGGMVQILSGVVEGESVVATGNFLLDSESKLKAAASGFGEISAGPGAGHGTGHGDAAAGGAGDASGAMGGEGPR